MTCVILIFFIFWNTSWNAGKWQWFKQHEDFKIFWGKIGNLFLGNLWTSQNNKLPSFLPSLPRLHNMFTEIELKKVVRHSRRKSWWSSRSWGFRCKQYIFHQLKGNTISVFLNYGASQYYASCTRREILINGAIFTKQMAWNAIKTSYI